MCAAVQYAHQNLVVHRDLKPGNILVGADGVPKLLDFGIAKLLSPDGAAIAGGETGTLFRLLTPDYASPEQIRGERITTASDVYSLGVVLYELLAGRKPYHVTGSDPAELLRVVCERDPEKPSAAARSRELEGDLDAIVLKAMRKEPERRYASVGELAEDLRRRRTGEPVAARRGTFVYRAGKFARRHRVGFAAAALVAIALAGGVVATLREAARARSAEARAQRRFDDVRRLANSFLFEFHDAIRDLPGSTPARALIVTPRRSSTSTIWRRSPPATGRCGGSSPRRTSRSATCRAIRSWRTSETSREPSRATARPSRCSNRASRRAPQRTPSRRRWRRLT